MDPHALPASAPVIDKLVDFGTAPGGDLVIKHTQLLPDEFLTECALERADSISTPAGDFHRVASIPAAAWEYLHKNGIDVIHAPIADILKWLRKYDMDKFITSNKV